MKKTILSLWLAGSSLAASLALAEPAPPPAAPFAMDRPALISNKAKSSALLTVTHAGKRLVTAGERGIVLYSDDNGAHWTQAMTPTSNTLTAVRFVDDRRGWAVGHMGIVLHTEDGGKTWVKQLDGVRAAQLAYETAQKSGDEKALHQATYLVSDGPDKPFFDLSFDQNGHGLIVGAYNLAFGTEDGGKTWQYWSLKIDNPHSLHLYAIARTADAIYLAGEQGLILRSTDQGEHFSQLTSPYQGSWFGALNSQQGLVLYGLRGNAYLLPKDGGDWKKLTTGTMASISAATELHDGRLLLACQSGQLLVEGSGNAFSPIPMKALSPLSAVTEGQDHKLVLTSLRGVINTSINPNN